MKYALLALVALVSCSACKKTYINQTVDQAYSAIYTVQPGDWVQGQNSDQTVFYYVTLNIPELDDIINTHGGVEVYISFNGGTDYETVPEVFDGVAYGSLHSTGQVTVDLRDANGGSLSSAISGPLTVKVVLIDAQPLD
jgi:hypothetical protein